MNQSQVHRKIEVVQKGQVSNLHIPEELQLYTVWKVFTLPEEQMKYPGQTPQQIIENLIYYYTDPITETTKPDDVPIVLDPMAGILC